MEKDLRYMKLLSSKKAERLNDLYKSFYEETKRNKQQEGSFNNAVHISAYFCQLILNDAIKTREKELEELPRMHRAAAKADSYEALLYYELRQMGEVDAYIANFINIYRLYPREAHPYKRIPYRVPYRITGIKKDLPRKKLTRAIKEYEPEQEDSHNKRQEEITNQRLLQIPFIRALIDLYEGVPDRERDRAELIAELDTLINFIDSIEQANEKGLFIARYEQGLDWLDVAAGCGGLFLTEDNARKTVERYLIKYNEGLKNKSDQDEK